MINDKLAMTAKQIRLAKLEYEVAQAEADAKKKIYEALRVQLTNDMVSCELPKFEIAASQEEGLSGLSFRLETKERWSPVVDNKDQLIEVLKQDAPEIFTVTAPALSKFIGEVVASNDGEIPARYAGLVKVYEDTHVVVRLKK